jgi:hypothetical protein
MCTVLLPPGVNPIAVNVCIYIISCINLESTRPRGRPRNRWQDQVREDGKIVGGEEWQEKYI